MIIYMTFLILFIVAFLYMIIKRVTFSLSDSIVKNNIIQSEVLRNELISNIIIQGCGFAEQTSEICFKLTNNKIPSSEKIIAAKTYIYTMLDEHKIIAPSEESISMKIEACLGFMVLNLNTALGRVESDGNDESLGEFGENTNN